MFNLKHKNNVYFCWGLTAFLTVFAILAAYDIFLGAHKLMDYFGIFTTIMTPVLLGGTIAYLLSPVVDFFERTLLHPWATHALVVRKPIGWVRVVSILLTFLSVFGIFVILMRFLIPNVWSSIIQLVENIPMYIELTKQLFSELGGSITIPPELYNHLNTLYNEGMAMIKQITSSGLSSVIATVSGGVFGVLSFIANLIVGFVIAAYMLGMKERLLAQSKKIICALFHPAYVERIIDAARYSDSVFGGFIRGNLLDAAIVGIICFIAFQILHIPYAPLLSVLIGVTNLIPFFGPFMGAIPSCILIFLVNPIQCLEFIIFILVLQQVDGNIIVPRILGRSTGLSSLWVIISVLIGGGLFGPLGMLLGCPVFALFYAFFRASVGKGLEQKHMPADTDEYRTRGIPKHPKDSDSST